LETLIMAPGPSPSSSQPPRLLDSLRLRLQAHHVSAATVDHYLHWALQYILFHGKQHPRELSEAHVCAFLAHLAANRPDAAAPARLALLFLYREELGRPLREHLLAPAANTQTPQPEAPTAPPVPVPTFPRSPRLLDQVRDLMRLRHYSFKTEECYVGWITRSIRFHGKRDLGAAAIEAFLTYLAVDQHVAASTQNQAFFALLFLYQEVLAIQLPRLDAIRAKRPERLPVVMSRPEVRQVLERVVGAQGNYSLM
jgi:hypothetical protein